jgi:hypothetical protein
MSPRERTLLGVLAGLVVLLAGGVALIQVVGGALGAPCADSYSCAGFLVGGAECVEVGPKTRYCTRYCDAHADCPAGWQCLSATPTALGVETPVLDEVCIR